ncbi:MAG TPA: type I DNA topoisomerase, partial [Mycobacteriales bacterium]|nr:type I DNA topoisomerase [Mycobacteriales bacterium]
VDAQETRRILDRLYGYEVSPVLWKKVMPRLSAGRVQSVATRILVERERARIRFTSAGYWDLEGRFAPAAQPTRVATGASAEDSSGGAGGFAATLVGVDRRRVATGRDFDETGALKAAELVRLDEPAACGLAARLADAAFAVRSVEEKPYRRSPYPPFMTSTLQQEAARKLRFSSQHTMRVAQRLYENGYITYMRTDSTTLSDSALRAAREEIRDRYGAEYLPREPRRYDKKVKNAQEAHEAIRPAGERFRSPADVAAGLSSDERRLYDLVWRRSVASQMADAVGSSVSVRLGAVSSAGEDAEFAATGKVITFPGFLRAYVEGADDPEAESDDAETRLPQLATGASLAVAGIEPRGHATAPPARFTEASLIKALEELGVGRPSTYASILGTIQDRGYVFKKGQALVPSFTAFAVVGLLEQHFARLVDYGFTAAMEDDLDDIANGAQESVPWLTRFYFGDPASVDDADQVATQPSAGGLQSMVSERLGEIDAREVNSILVGSDPRTGLDVVVRVGRYGPYVQAGEDRASIPEDLPPDELTVPAALELLAAPSGDSVLGTDPQTGGQVVARAGRYGPYVTIVLPEGEHADSPDSTTPASAKPTPAKRAPAKPAATKRATAKPAATKRATAKPPTASLLKSQSLDTLTLEQAMLLLSLPRVLGVTADGEEVLAANGRYGPYVKKGAEFRSLAGEELLFTVTLEEALALLAQPKTRGRAASSAPPLRELGADPASGKALVVRDGRFGPYVTDGETNASLRKGDVVDELTVERAAELLEDRRARGPAPKKRATARRGAR